MNGNTKEFDMECSVIKNLSIYRSIYLLYVRLDIFSDMPWDIFLLINYFRNWTDAKWPLFEYRFAKISTWV